MAISPSASASSSTVPSTSRRVTPIARSTPSVCAPLHDRERHRAVDQEHAHHEREQAERPQVRAKRGCELRECPILAFGGYEHGAGRHGALESLRLARRELQVDPADRSQATGELLRRGDVGDDRRLGFSVPRGRRNGSEHPYAHLAPSYGQRDRVARSEAELVRKRGRQQNRPRLGDEAGEVRAAAGDVAREVTDGGFLQRIDPE